MRLGVDVGGTNTDAVLMDQRHVIAEFKTPVTPDITTGIISAIEGLQQQRGFAPADIEAVMIGTTHFTNAVAEGRRLMPTAAVRLGLPATAALPPMTDWPGRLRDALGGHVFLCHGGHEFDGRQISPMDRGELRKVAEQIAERGIRTVAISSVFSPITDEMEVEAAAVLRETLPEAALSLSHEIGRVGLLERENATILNACLRDLADGIATALEDAVSRAGISAPLYISQNDGTLMSVSYCRQYPVATFASGPTNSMRGAAFLSGEADCVVVDVGGTTTDVGSLQHGFPREATVAVEVGGVRTNFRMPDVLSVALAGGSVVRGEGDDLTLGPDSVGYQITERALVFGGSTLTTTDLAVAAGMCQIGDHALVGHLDRGLVHRGVRILQDRIAEAVDRVKTSAELVPVVVVGGGSVLVPDKLDGASHVVKPGHFAVANAIGAAIAQVGGETEKVFSLDGLTREQALDQARQEAVDKAAAAGARRASVTVVDVEEVPLAYLPSNAVRIRIKAVGDLELGGADAAAGF
jgi:N-methylhydantoinase A/oxoprolinase/acetone carboxylase beta subunit